MASVTIRDLPPELHKALKDCADENRRSLNSEMIVRLQQSVRERGRRPSDEEIRERARRFRESLRQSGFKPLTDEEITRYKNQGRL